MLLKELSCLVRAPSETGKESKYISFGQKVKGFDQKPAVSEKGGEGGGTFGLERLERLEELERFF